MEGYTPPSPPEYASPPAPPTETLSQESPVPVSSPTESPPAIPPPTEPPPDIPPATEPPPAVPPATEPPPAIPPATEPPPVVPPATEPPPAVPPATEPPLAVPPATEPPPAIPPATEPPPAAPPATEPPPAVPPAMEPPPAVPPATEPPPAIPPPTESPPTPPQPPTGSLSPKDSPFNHDFGDPSPTKNISFTHNSNDTSSRKVGVGALVGIILGVVVVVGIFVIIFIRRRRWRLINSDKALEDQSEAPPQSPKGPLQDCRKSEYPPTDYRAPPPANPSFSISPSTSSSVGSNKPFTPPSPGFNHGLLQSTFTYEELKVATDNFSDKNLLGQGGFGFVHKGVLPNGKVVAIKQLKAGSAQGEREFRSEVDIISRVHHRHLVSLVGYCIYGVQRLLVYEFVPNKTLDFHLHEEGKPVLDWSTRMKIALGSARGLAYLHEHCQPKIIHRDIKSANILIDNSFEAKVADFGLAKCFLEADTHVTTRIMGTFGYLAPEYAASGLLTEKSDIFSFGVLLLELITGLRPSTKAHSSVDNSMVDWAKPLLKKALDEDGNFEALVDRKLQEYDPRELYRMAACAAAAVRHSAWRRPKMSQIVRALEGNMSLDDLNDGITPGQSTIYSSHGSSDYSSSQHKENVNKFWKLALESRVYGSSEHSGPTSEYSHYHTSLSTEGQLSTQEMEP